MTVTVGDWEETTAEDSGFQTGVRKGREVGIHAE